jgi:hypothetical protein
MTRHLLGLSAARFLSVIVAGAVLSMGPFALAQGPNSTPSSPANAPILSPNQLDNLVAPIALYPDPVLSQVLVASTYPLEVVEAEQWLQQNRTLTGAQLMDAARQQNWDPSVQALVALPDVLARLNQDVRWTNDLGNAFLAQQADVMSAVQRMRSRAQANGKLGSTSQETVSTVTQNGPSCSSAGYSLSEPSTSGAVPGSFGGIGEGKPAAISGTELAHEPDQSFMAAWFRKYQGTSFPGQSG